ncbi:unnamed protein product [Periconia digitata]|uniref:Uncharacterized protein n=1 Tax=Periconia digitata TaxID=1303443 RepID=A0A9W4UPG6_9PLEO|nr:unnamed protein product [Periconia digitata]
MDRVIVGRLYLCSRPAVYGERQCTCACARYISRMIGERLSNRAQRPRMHRVLAWKGFPVDRRRERKKKQTLHTQRAILPAIIPLPDALTDHPKLFVEHTNFAALLFHLVFPQVPTEKSLSSVERGRGAGQGPSRRHDIGRFCHPDCPCLLACLRCPFLTVHVERYAICNARRTCFIHGTWKPFRRM